MCIIKQTYEVCDKNISEEKYEKLQNYVFKIKEFNSIILGKGLFASIDVKLCLTKGHLGNQEGQVKMKYRICFWHFWVKLNKNFFFKKGTSLGRVQSPDAWSF